MPNLPGVDVSLQSVSETLNPQSLSSIFMVCGPSSAGPLDTPTKLNSLADCAQFGNGPGIEQAAEIGSTAGWPVFFTRTVTTNVSVLSAVAKTPATQSGTPLEIFGQILLPGSAGNHLGNVIIESLVPGITLTVVQGGA